MNLDTKVHLLGAPAPLEVRFARSHHYIQAGSGPAGNKQLFFSKTPYIATEEQLFLIFRAFGVVSEFNLFRDRHTGESKGSGFVTMETREAAVKVMENLNDENDPKSMVVKWADPDLQEKKKKALEISNEDNRMLFFAKVLRAASEDDIRELFAQFGKVSDVNVFRAFQGAPTTKGCGLVTMAEHEDALSAIETLDSKYVWRGMDAPMVVKWMDGALQRRRREQHLANIRGVGGQMSNSDLGWIQQSSQNSLQLPASSSWPGLMSMLGPGAGGGLGHFIGATSGLPGLSHSQMQMAAAAVASSINTDTGEGADEQPPVGCAPDAIKLFVGNLPKSCTEEHLHPFFETVGKVVELVVVRDKSTHESKGSAFVWYATRVTAERAILQFNLRHVLPDPSGEQNRPLVVRKAKTRSRPPMGNPGVGPPPMNNPSFPPFFGQLEHGMGGLVDLHSLYPSLGGLHPGAMMMGGMPPRVSGTHGPNPASMGLVDNFAGLSLQQAASASGGLNLAATARFGAGLDLPSPTLGAEAISFPGASLPLFDAQTLTMNQQQLMTISQPQLYTMIQQVSGAHLSLSSSGTHPGIFNVLISGRKDQVESAKDLIGSVVNAPPP